MTEIYTGTSKYMRNVSERQPARSLAMADNNPFWVDRSSPPDAIAVCSIAACSDGDRGPRNGSTGTIAA